MFNRKKEDVFEVVTAMQGSDKVYYKGRGEVTTDINEAKVFKNGGGWFNTVGNAIYDMKENMSQNGINVEKYNG